MLSSSAACPSVLVLEPQHDAMTRVLLLPHLHTLTMCAALLQTHAAGASKSISWQQSAASWQDAGLCNPNVQQIHGCTVQAGVCTSTAVALAAVSSNSAAELPVGGHSSRMQGALRIGTG